MGTARTMPAQPPLQSESSHKRGDRDFQPTFSKMPEGADATSSEPGRRTPRMTQCRASAEIRIPNRSPYIRCARPSVPVPAVLMERHLKMAALRAGEGAVGADLSFSRCMALPEDSPGLSRFRQTARRRLAPPAGSGAFRRARRDRRLQSAQAAREQFNESRSGRK